MLSKAELSTALPRAGGTYYFLDRSLGPLVGTVGGLGTYLALTLKTAFALIGIGAYAALFVELPIKPVAVAMTVAFVAINIVGAKESSGLQRLLVVILLTVMAFFVVQGGIEVFAEQPTSVTKSHLDPFMPFGLEGLLSTIGFVFVSYAGLTKVASVAEEIKNPDRNIPLGMMLSLASTTAVYVVGVFIMVSVLEPSELYTDLTPVATAAEAFFDWLPQPTGLLLIVVAALAAFASTGNAGVLSASRYPLAMARDRLLPERFANLGRFQTPTSAILATGILMIVFILTLDESGIAKLASAFQLFIFGFVNVAVIVMRESRLPSYDPGFRSPFYPWMQLLGILVSAVLIAYMGWMAVLFTIGTIAVCLAWYFKYVRNNVVRDGAIYHWFEHLGRRRYAELDRELRGIMKEKGLRADDPFNELVAHADVLDFQDVVTFEEVVHRASELLAARLPVPAETLEEAFLEGTRTGDTPVAHGAALPHLHLPGLDRPEMVLVRTRAGMKLNVQEAPWQEDNELIYAIFLLASPGEDPSQHLRTLAQIANSVDESEFIKDWLEAPDGTHLKELLMISERYLIMRIRSIDLTGSLVGTAIKDAGFPANSLVAFVRRGNDTIVPQGSTILQDGDRVTIIGDQPALASVRTTYQIET
jgi:amino acid transporter/mannitol/fructose-specific phosphotransferase system IIA component (Ntr-type)